MIDVIRIPLSKDLLKTIPKDERALFFLLGYSANQIILFSKLVIFSTNKTQNEEAEQKISGAQSQMLVRFLMGILFETWKLISTRFLATQIGKEFVPKLNPAGQEALTELKKHFGSSNLLSKLRNNVAFHHPYESDLDAGFIAAVNDKDWENDWNWYFSVDTFNSFYFASDFVIMHGILSAIGENNLIEAHTKIMDEVNKVSKHMISLLYALHDSFLAKYFDPTMTAEVIAKIKSAPNVFDVWLPFYVEIPSDGIMPVPNGTLIPRD